MAIYTSMPDKAKEAMVIINENYDLFKEEFVSFFEDLKNYVANNNNLHQYMPKCNPKG